MHFEEDNWSNIGGCSLKHPFSKDKREDCEEDFLSKKGVKASETQAEADKLMAEALLAKSKQAQQPDAWTPERTAKVVGISLGVIMVGVIAVVLIRRKRKKNK